MIVIHAKFWLDTLLLHPNLVDIEHLELAAAESVSSTSKDIPTKPVEKKTPSTSAIEDLFKDSPSIMESAVPEQSKKDTKNDIMSLFEKVLAISYCF